MKNLRAVLCMIGVVLLSAPSAFASNHSPVSGPVLVELFTSQGCSSCPPADKVLHKLAERDDVVALSFHVDYWDYIGWKDTFSQARFTRRQRSYARKLGWKTIYTPQLVIAGERNVIGSQVREIDAAISQSVIYPPKITAHINREGEQLVVDVQGTPESSDVDIFLVKVLPEAEVEIKRGENRGRKLHYTNIVQSIDRVGSYAGPKWRETFPDSDDSSFAVIVQERGHGVVLASAILR